ncbi:MULTISPECIES: DUF6338 family protein [Acinetobacter]|jgi:hypothetical protein|uniref:DUF6338 family protein n=1 Tax=Acinetobacter TaxID=469 RepID=UPI00287CDBFB|nr:MULTISPECIES: DUF6338 family protein [Acinetobacter]MDS7924564.1 DUF6338 family protein [Acinetobacter sp. V115_6]WQF72732.1 DUF6338 family protein [Acinetobacter oleivorans]
MELIDQSKLAFFIAFILPGFICMRVYTLLCPTQSIEFNQKILDALTYSCLIYGFNFIFIYWIEELTKVYSFPFLYGLFYFYLLFLCPILLANYWHKIRESKWFQRRAPHPTLLPWDFVFSKRTVCWVIITLNDGTKIHGRYGKNSFVSNYPLEPQIYLDEFWKPDVDGGFDRKYNLSAGIILLSKDIRSIEFYEDEDQVK